MVHPKGIGLAIARLGFAVNPAEREGNASLPGAFHAPSNPFGVPFFTKKMVHPKCRTNYPQLELKISYNPLA